MTLNEHHDTDEVRAELARICDQFREGLLATLVPLSGSPKATPAVDPEAEETRRTIEKINAKEFISADEAAFLFSCSEQHLRNQVQKAIDGTAVHPIPFADIDNVTRFPLKELLEWASLPKPKPKEKRKRKKNEERIYRPLENNLLRPSNSKTMMVTLQLACNLPFQRREERT
jgi:hypothetical protein